MNTLGTGIADHERGSKPRHLSITGKHDFFIISADDPTLLTGPSRFIGGARAVRSLVIRGQRHGD